MSLRLVDTADQRPADGELHGTSISGSGRDGDWAELEDARHRSGRYEPLSLTNLTTGAEVSVRGHPRSPGNRVGQVLLVVFRLVALAASGFALTTLTRF